MNEYQTELLAQLTCTLQGVEQMLSGIDDSLGKINQALRGESEVSKSIDLATKRLEDIADTILQK